MEMFVNTAFRYLKGNSDLPSLIPSKEAANLAKEKSRKLRLFCKGLEYFCEIFYVEPMAEMRGVDLHGANQDHAIGAGPGEGGDGEVPAGGKDQTMMTADEGPSAFAVGQDDAVPNVHDTVSEPLVDRDGEDDGTGILASHEHVKPPTGQDQTLMMTTVEEGPSEFAVRQDDAALSVHDTVSEPLVDRDGEYDGTAILASHEHISPPTGQDKAIMMTTAEKGPSEFAVRQDDAAPSVEDTISEQLVDCKVEHGDEVKMAGEEHVGAVTGQDETMMTAEKDHSKSAGPQDQTVITAEEGYSKSALQQGQMTTTVEGHSKSAIQQDIAFASEVDTFLEKSIDDELAGSGDSAQDQGHPSAETKVLGTKVDQKPRKYVLASGEDLFQSLYATDNTPPTSPGGASSSSTLVDPSSRKVSPSDSTMDTKSSTIAVKDFAYPPHDPRHVPDPLSIVEVSTKLELLRQLRKTTAGEELAAQKAEKIKVENLTLSAELGAANKKLRSMAIEADVTRVHANAMILSNLTLRSIRDLLERRDERHGVGVETINPAGETPGDQETEGDFQTNLRAAGTTVASADPDEIILSESPDEFEGSSAYDDAQESMQLQQVPLTREVVEIEQCGSTAVEEGDWRASEEPRSGLIGSGISACASASQLEGFLDESKGQVDDSSTKIGSDEPALSDTMISVESTGSKVLDKVETQGQVEATGEISLSSTRNDQESNSSLSIGSWTAQDFEFSEPAGPAILWGILHSSPGEGEAAKEVNAVKEAANVSDTPGPATLWGIPQSNQSTHQAKDTKAADTTLADDADEPNGEAGETKPSPRAETSPVVSAGAPGAVGAKSDDSDLAVPSKQAPPEELTKTQKRKLERKRAAAKKAAGAQRAKGGDFVGGGE